VRRCVYLDKDLVLPPTESAGPAEAFFVVASIDMQRSGVMTRRIREQIDRVADFASKGSLTITTVPIEFSPSPRDCLDMQVEQVAQRVTQTVIRAIAGKDASANGGN
jgi:hypothetical protein